MAEELATSTQVFHIVTTNFMLGVMTVRLRIGTSAQVDEHMGT